MRKVHNYVKELGEVLKTADIEELKKFARKHGQDLSKEDEILEIWMHKMICTRTDMPEELKKESREWLVSRGYSPFIF